MSTFIDLLKILAICGTLLIVAVVVLLSLPDSQLRRVCVRIGKWILVSILAILVLLPIDVIPDFLIGIGQLDDIGYIVGAIATARSAIADRKKQIAASAVKVRRTSDRAESEAGNE